MAELFDLSCSVIIVKVEGLRVQGRGMVLGKLQVPGRPADLENSTAWAY